MRHDLEPGIIKRREDGKQVCQLAQQHHVPRGCLCKPTKGARGRLSCKVRDVGEPEKEIEVVTAHREDFLGGEFFFEGAGADGGDLLVEPRRGRAVLFDAGTRHGLRPVVSGERVALNIWFTRAPEAAED